MRILIQILVFIPLLSFGQTFKLTDTIFKVGDLLRTYNIEFDLAKPWLSKDNNKFLDSLSDFMLSNQNIVFEISNHCDSRQWTDQSSFCLTCKRAESIKNYLIEKGVNPAFLISNGYNDSDPIISDLEISKLKSEEEKQNAYQINRRSEIKIVEIKKKSEPIFDFYILDKKPIYPGGEDELLKYFSKNFKYPELSKDCYISSKIYFSFIIDTIGKPINPTIKNNNCIVTEPLKKELFNLIENMPHWTPGEYKGRKVRVQFNIPLHIDPNY